MGAAQLLAGAVASAVFLGGSLVRWRYRRRITGLLQGILDELRSRAP